MTKIIFFLTATLLTLSAQAWKGSVSFSASEKAQHLQTLSTLLSQSKSCLETNLQYHQKFFRQYGISPFYGDVSSFSKLSTAERRQTLQDMGVDPALVSQLRPTSCVGYATMCLERGFAAAGQQALWKKVDAYVELNDYDGTALQNALRELGWKVVYWNPDVSQNQAWDREEQRLDPEDHGAFWGYHEERWHSVSTRHTYYFNVVDDIKMLVNFGRQTPQVFKNIPYFVGTAHTGYHVFSGSFGQVVEGHSTRAINDPQTVETSPFGPLNDGGGPRGRYRSGLMAVPPGY